MKRVSVWFAGALVGLLTLVASAGAASASGFIWHESDVPEKLRK